MVKTLVITQTLKNKEMLKRTFLFLLLLSSSMNHFYEAFHSSVVSPTTKTKESATLPLAFNCLLACNSGKLNR